jgi:hypothetical protein
MKRDPDLIREILLELEKENFDGTLQELSLGRHSDDKVQYHIRLLSDAGYVDAEDTSSHSGISMHVRRLTWEGHEFLDAARDDKRWAEAKELMLQKSGGLIFDVLKQLLVNLATRAVLG